MMQKNIKISKNQRLADIMTEIPSNTILFKTLTGIGATHLELITQRHSIIIEPNVPVITGKRKNKDFKILGVMEGVSIHNVMSYLKNDKIMYKKIMTTPESFHKVQEAVTRLSIDIYSDYFLMYDECDKTAKDVDFRPNIILPLEVFFKFKNKAFVSATALVPSDPRFKQQNFTVLEVEPDYDFSKKLFLLVGNNPLNATNQLFEKHIKVEEHEKVFVFFNSTLGISSIIQRAGISKISTVFCGRDSLKNVKNAGITAYENLDESKFSKFNFLTSRFFSAVDINIEEKPHVVIIADLNVAEHTMIDPCSELIQIAGRFRNIELASLSLLTNFDMDMTYMGTKEAIQYLKGCRDSYMQIKNLRDIAQNGGAKDTLNEALERITYSQFLDKYGKTNYFMYDNFLHSERIKSYYSHFNSLNQIFSSDERLKKHFRTEFHEYMYNARSFYPRLKEQHTYEEIVTKIVTELDLMLSSDQPLFDLQKKEDVYKEVKLSYPLIVEAYEKLGGEKLLEICSRKSNVEKALLELKEQEEATNNFSFLDELYATFQLGVFFPEKFISEKFDEMIEKYNLPYTNRKKRLGYLKKFIELSNRTSKRGVKGYRINRHVYR